MAKYTITYTKEELTQLISQFYWLISYQPIHEVLHIEKSDSSLPEIQNKTLKFFGSICSNNINDEAGVILLKQFATFITSNIHKINSGKISSLPGFKFFLLLQSLRKADDLNDYKHAHGGIRACLLSLAKEHETTAQEAIQLAADGITQSLPKDFLHSETSKAKDLLSEAVKKHTVLPEIKSNSLFFERKESAGKYISTADQSRAQQREMRIEAILNDFYQNKKLTSDIGLDELFQILVNQRTSDLHNMKKTQIIEEYSQEEQDAFQKQAAIQIIGYGLEHSIITLDQAQECANIFNISSNIVKTPSETKLANK